MIIKVRVSLNLVGCSSYSIIEVDEESVEGMSEEELEEYIRTIAIDEILGNGLIDWNWNVVD